MSDYNRIPADEFMHITDNKEYRAQKRAETEREIARANHATRPDPTRVVDFTSEQEALDKLIAYCEMKLRRK